LDKTGGMISNVFLHKNLWFIQIFKPDLRQYRMKCALFTTRDPDFCLQERVGSFQMQHKHADDHQRAYRIIVTTVATACNIRLIVETIIASNGHGLSCWT